MLEEIEFHRLAKLRLEVDEPEELWVSKKVNLLLLLITINTEIHTDDFSHMTNPTTA
jgi:hypothetical protein